jgi:ubiquinone/menaquinone biosynthesis C-methylase UbiE
MASYEAFARFYDAVQGDRAEALLFVRPHLAGAKTVLERACGAGSILAELQSGYEVVGVDLSPQMLEIAGSSASSSTSTATSTGWPRR